MQEIVVLNFATSESLGEIKKKIPVLRLYQYQLIQDLWGRGPGTEIFLEVPGDPSVQPTWEPVLQPQASHTLMYWFVS